MNEDWEFEETLRRLSGPVDRRGVWAAIEARAGGEHWAIGERGQEGAQPGARRPRGLNLRVAVFASVAVVLVAAVAIGSFVAVRNLTRPDFVLRITDDTDLDTGGQGTGSSTESGYWERLPLARAGIPINTLVLDPRTLVLDPRNPSDLYAETAAGLFKSSDGAGSWKQTLDFSALAGHVDLLILDPAAPSTVYVIMGPLDDATSRPVLRSDDGGATWADLTETMPPNTKIMVWPPIMWVDATSSPSTVYICDQSANVLRSTDRGETWTELSQEDVVPEVGAAVKPPLPAAAQQALDAFLASFEGTVTDADTGAVVGVVPAGNGVPEGTRAESVIVDPDQPSILYAPTMDGVYKSIDGGRSWRKASTGFGVPAISRFAVDPLTPSTLYAATTAGIFRSTDGGVEWTLILAGEGSVALAPSTPSRLYAWTSIGPFRSDDGGLNWVGLAGQGLSGPTARGLALVAVDNPDIVFAMAAGVTGPESGLSRSTDGGNTWSEVLEGATCVAADPKTPSTLFAAVSSQVFKSIDTGGTWTVVSPEEWVDAVVDIAVDPHDPFGVYAVQCSDTGAYSVSRSVDGGATWQKVDLEGPAKYIQQLLFDPRSPDTLYVLTSQVVESVAKAGMYRSVDGGATWENIMGELPDTGYLNIVIDPASSGGLYATTTGGLFKWVPKSE